MEVPVVPAPNFAVYISSDEEEEEMQVAQPLGQAGNEPEPEPAPECEFTHEGKILSGLNC